MNKNSKLLIVGGHMTPALSVLEELRIKGFKDIIWVGHKYNQAGTKAESNEFNIVSSQGVKFIDLKTGKLVRYVDLSNILYFLKQFLLIFTGFFSAAKVIFNEKPDLVISFGGYLSVPLVVWAKLAGKKIITHEQTIVVGLANKIITWFADYIFVSWEESLKYFPSKKTSWVGNPIRTSIFELRSISGFYSFNPKLKTIYVTGGNQGANFINQLIFKKIDALLDTYNIIHQTGNSSVTGDFQTALQIRESLPEELKERYFVKDFFTQDEIGTVFNKSDMVISRAGANTVMELLALAKPSILIPIPKTSYDEQTKNALFAEQIGIAVMLEQNKIDEEVLLNVINKIMQNIKNKFAVNGEDLEKVSIAAKQSVKLDAAKIIVEKIMNI